MPSRDEIANVASLVINVESKVDDLEDQMDVNKFDTSKEIEQLKKGLNNLDKKLDKVIELLGNSLVSQNTPKVTAGPIITPAPNSYEYCKCYKCYKFTMLQMLRNNSLLFK